MAETKKNKTRQQKAPIRISNPKIGLALVEELRDEPAYQNVKAFTATHAFLRKVLYFSQDHEFASIQASVIKELFESYDVKYKECLDALERRKIATWRYW